MAWAKLDDRFYLHPKVVGLTDGAFRLHVSAICYAAQHDTSGKLPAGAVRLLDGSKRIVGELVGARLWEEIPGGYYIHDYLDYNPTAEEAAARRRARSEAGRRGGQISGQRRRESAPEGSNSASGGLSPPQASAEASASCVASPTVEANANPVPVPVPVATTVVVASSGADLEIRDTVVLAMGRKGHDPDLFADAERLAADFAGQPDLIAGAIGECKRRREFSSPYNLRKYLPAPLVKFKSALAVPDEDLDLAEFWKPLTERGAS